MTPSGTEPATLRLVAQEDSQNETESSFLCIWLYCFRELKYIDLICTTYFNINITPHYAPLCIGIFLI